jgi:hypothetical protein
LAYAVICKQSLQDLTVKPSLLNDSTLQGKILPIMPECANHGVKREIMRVKRANYFLYAMDFSKRLSAAQRTFSGIDRKF